MVFILGHRYIYISTNFRYIVVDTRNEKLETYFARGGSQLTYGMKRKE